MKVKELIHFLKQEDPELSVELSKVVAIPLPNKAERGAPGTPYLMRLDFPILGMARKDTDLLLVIEAAPQMIAFGKDITRLDGEPLDADDVKNIGGSMD